MHRLIVEPGGIEVLITPGDTIDQALDKAGWYRPWGGCRAGGCGACNAVVLDTETCSGEQVSFASARGDLGTRSGARRILVCVAVPTSDLTITFRNGTVRPQAT